MHILAACLILLVCFTPQLAYAAGVSHLHCSVVGPVYCSGGSGIWRHLELREELADVRARLQQGRQHRRWATPVGRRGHRVHRALVHSCTPPQPKGHAETGLSMWLACQRWPNALGRTICSGPRSRAGPVVTRLAGHANELEVRQHVAAQVVRNYQRPNRGATLDHGAAGEVGRASCRERVFGYV